MKVCYTALFGPYEELKEPTVVTPGWEYICFTDQDLTSSTWQIRKVTIPEGKDKQWHARYFKIMEWVDWRYSMWVDASFRIDTDLNDWWQKYFLKPFSVPAHPTRNCVFEEIESAIGANRGNREQLLAQYDEYRKAGVKRGQGIITSGLLMRENTPEVIRLCEHWWQEMFGRSVRDQVAFGRIWKDYENLVHRYDYDYTLNTHFRYFKHFNRR